MDFGLHFPQPEMPHDGSAIRDFVVTAEHLGYRFINVPDHVIQTRTPVADFAMAANYTTEFANHETMTVLAFAAAATQVIRLKAAVLVLPQRQAVLAAKQAAQIDVLSGGRMELGVGVGWNDPEYTALDLDFGNRGKRMEEQIDVMRQLWTEQHVTYNGHWHTIDDAGLAPMPIQQPIPIWIGAFNDVAVARAARIADGWQSLVREPDGQARQLFAKFNEHVKKAGRNSAEVGIEAPLFATEIDQKKWVGQVEQWVDVGATQLVFRPLGEFGQIQEMNEAFAEVMTTL